MNKIRVIDLFSGCGGLVEGFMQTGLYDPTASVEWEKSPVTTLSHRLKTKWNIEHADESSIWFDIQRIDELFNGFKDDPKYGSSKGLDYFVNETNGIDVIIGGPPCQAYSVAGRIQDKNRMREDYRNYLFEYYLKVVDRYKPKLFVFENVPGMLSAMPDGTPITDLIRRDVEAKGYEIIDDIKGHALINMSEFSVPQNRRRVILIGVRKDLFSSSKIQDILLDFYDNILSKYKGDKTISVEDAIGDLEKCFPLEDPITIKGMGKFSHSVPESNVSSHVPRFHNRRDINIFQMLAADIEEGTFEFTDSNKLNEIYNKATGGNTAVHKYHVLRKDLPSTTILAHLYKDGLRFIHYDSEQARSITVREAARLQGFPDDFEFVAPRGSQYKMIGNAVPPIFSQQLAQAVSELLDKYIVKDKENERLAIS
jgi:DNA (cytosine-5)-methyltransferase 1